MRCTEHPSVLFPFILFGSITMFSMVLFAMIGYAFGGPSAAREWMYMGVIVSLFINVAVAIGSD